MYIYVYIYIYTRYYATFNWYCTFCRHTVLIQHIWHSLPHKAGAANPCSCNSVEKSSSTMDSFVYRTCATRICSNRYNCIACWPTLSNLSTVLHIFYRFWSFYSERVIREAKTWKVWRDMPQRVTPEFVLESCVRQCTSIRNEHIMLTLGEPKRKQFICRQVPIVTILETYLDIVLGVGPKRVNGQGLWIRVWHLYNLATDHHHFTVRVFRGFPPVSMEISSQVVQFVADRESMVFFHVVKSIIVGYSRILMV